MPTRPPPQANKWCNEGVDLLASQPIDRLQTTAGAQAAQREIQDFMAKSRDLKLSNPRDFRNLFEPIMTAESRVRM